MIDIPEVQCGQGRIEGAAPRDVVDDEQERIELLETPELRHGARRPGIPSRGHIDAGGQREGAAQVGCSEGAKLRRR